MKLKNVTVRARALGNRGWNSVRGGLTSNRKRVVAVAAAVTLVSLGGVAGASAAAKVTPLAVDCSHSALAPHDGFQKSPACVSTADGEVSAFDKNPELAFINPPDKVRSGRDFTLNVSTRNLVRDRFLAAGDGGYYAETSLLDANGLTRGHFHVGCRVLASNGKEVKAAPVPDRSIFFKAVEDGKGGAKPDTVAVTVTGKDATTGKALFNKGDEVQCAAWAGDGSHRTPMMTFANSIPAFDSVRLSVKGYDW